MDILLTKETAGVRWSDLGQSLHGNNSLKLQKDRGSWCFWTCIVIVSIFRWPGKPNKRSSPLKKESVQLTCLKMSARIFLRRLSVVYVNIFLYFWFKVCARNPHKEARAHAQCPEMLYLFALLWNHSGLKGNGSEV